MGKKRTNRGLCLLLLAGVMAQGAQPLQPEPPVLPPPQNAQSIFENVRQLVFPLHTALRESAPKASYGSAFVVHKKGVAVTNYHVIASAVTEPSRYKLFANLPSGVVEAKVLAIDVIRDLAFVQVPLEFPAEIPIRSNPPQVGEKLYSIGQPADLNMSIVEGTYNGTQKAGPYEQIVLSSPINPGMSGGPTLDNQGKLVGINVAVLRKAQNISFAVPAAWLDPLLQNANSRQPASTEEKGWDPVILQQLEKAEEELTQEWLSQSSKRIELKEWKALAPPPTLKCWQDQVIAENLFLFVKSEFQDCFSFFQASPHDSVSAGNYEVSYMTLEKSKTHTVEFYETLNKTYQETPYQIGKEFFSLPNRQKGKYYTSSACTETVVVNRNNIPLKTNFCATGLKQFGNLADVLFKFMTVDKSKTALLVTLRLKGFKPENAKKIIESLIQGVERLDHHAGS